MENKQEVTEIEMKAMHLHEIIVIGPTTWIKRVPTGWIYYTQYQDLISSSFVPQKL